MIGIEIQGIPAVQAALAKAGSDATMHKCTQAVGEYMRGQLRKYPPYQYVSRARAYGKPFQSDKQRRWFFAALRSGELTLPYRRTDKLKAGWKLTWFGANDLYLTNDVEYAHFVQESPQARMMTYIGWRTQERIIYENREQIQRVTQETWNRAQK
jgi:hypothetical protein